MMITLEDISKTLEDNLKKAILKSGHFESGHLYDTIKVKFNKSKNGFDITAAEYIKYLDDGKFLPRLEKEEINRILPLLMQYYTQDIIKQLKETIKK